MHYELHFEPAGVPGGKAGDYVRKMLEDIQETAVRVENNEFSYIIPDDFHHGLVMLLHMQHHLLAEGIGLRHLSDWAVFVNTLSADVEEKSKFEDIFKERLMKIGLWNFAQNIRLSATMALGLPYQEWMGDNKKLAQALIADIFAGGNFGAKDDGRVTEGIFISNRGKDGVRHSRLIQAVLTLNQVAYTHCPITKKVKILLPLAWCYCIGRRIILVMMGKRKKSNLISAYKKSDSRRKLYAQMKLFEVE